MASINLPLARLADPTFVLLVLLGVGLWISGRGPRPPVSADPATAAAARKASRRARGGRIVAWLSFGVTWLMSTPLIASVGINAVETHGPDLGAALAGKDHDRAALVVLAGGFRAFDVGMPPSERLDASTQARIIGAARVYHAEGGFGLVIVSGYIDAQTEGMEELLDALGVPRSRVVRDSQARNTRENAAGSARILRERGIDTVVLVTSAVHLRRATWEFERIGVHVLPAAADLCGHGDFAWDSLLPSTGSMGRSGQVLHELLGWLRG